MRERVRSHGEDGFSLVEVMVSISVLVLASLGLFSAIVSSSHLERSVQSYVARAHALTDAFEQLHSGTLSTSVQQCTLYPTTTDQVASTTVSFPATTLSQVLPKYSSTSAPYSDLDCDGTLELVAANAAAPGLLAVRIVVGSGDEPRLTMDFLVANR